MEIRQVRYFLALAEERHFGRAAARVNVAQPALSQQIKQLERQVGSTLFDRSTRHVALTEAGRHLLTHARSILGEVERAEAHMAALASGRAGRVSVGFVGTATYDVLPRVARTVRSRLPGVSLELRGELLVPELVQGLADGTYDLAVLRTDGRLDAPVEVTPLRTERLVAVLPTRHPLAGHDRVPLAALADESFVVHPSQARSTMYAWVLGACARAGFRPATLVEVGETATLVVFVAAGHGVALVPESVQSLRLDGVTYVPLAEDEPVTLALARRSHPDPPVVDRVAEVVEASVRG
ncbi:LysR substrate-binding domain-containing protein [Streptomyces sp. SCSIO 75703]|uniref:LysR substrate-binding domain-containing protein n=1 Tax=unclassified Streptomyces TaxID=2593676 RepID=UPI0004C187E8|nr:MULTISPECIES: LysR substrate-binding domain-containing protein [unclassified Streptomyces]